MIRIGSLIIDGFAALAPMAGVTDLPFRLLCREQGCPFCVTEMVSAKGFLCMPKESLAARSLLLRAPQEGAVALQLFGREPSVMAEAARRLSDRGFDAIDINMGCPAPKITRSGEGSALLDDLPQAARVIEAVRRATKLPVTVKMRTGWDAAHIVAVDFARMAESSGADALTIHARTREQFYSGQADWSQIAAVKAAVGVPVFGNGDVCTASDAERMRRETGCDGVMIGRGALGNPWIFAEIAGRKAPGARERLETALRHARMLAAWKGEAVAVREMRKHAAWYTRGMPGAARARVAINAACTLKALAEALFSLEIRS